MLTLVSSHCLSIPIDQEQSRIISKALITYFDGKDDLLDSIHKKTTQIAAQILRKNLSLGAIEVLEDFYKNPDCLAILIDKIHYPDEIRLPCTPIDGRDSKCELEMRWIDSILLGLLDIASYQCTANTSENEGWLIRNVIPVKGLESETSSHGSTAKLGYHSDQPNYHLGRHKILSTYPDILSFISVRNQEKVPTKVIFIDELLNNLTCKTVKLLKEPAYTFKGPASTKTSPYSPIQINKPLLIDENGKYTLRFDPNVATASSGRSEHKEALQNLNDFLSTAKHSAQFELEPGQILIFKNRHILHSRDSFNRNKDQCQSRWLRRIYGVFTNKTDRG